MTEGATAKGARTLRSSGVARSQRQSPEPLRDGGPDAWTPARISDRKLLELSSRLERLRHVGDTFAAISLSPYALQRLRQLTGRP